MRKRTIKQREVVIVFCEGEAEILLFSFLKLQYSNKKIEFRKPIDLNGFNDFIEFKKKYAKHCRAQELKPKKRFLSVNFLFIFDNDLADSKKIEEFLKAQRHLVQMCNPNIEGIILAIAGKPQIKVVGDKEYRAKCKKRFEEYFGCEAHKLKEEKLKSVFSSEKVLKNILPVLYNLFKK